MKKLTILLLAVLLLVGTLSACGSSSGAPASSAASAASAASGSESPAQEPEKIGGTLNLLVMAGYEEDQIIKPFEEMYGVKVNAKIYPTSDQMFAMLQNAKEGEWDRCV